MAKPSILIVDDEPINLKLSAESLSPFYTIHLARSGQEALTYLETQDIDLVLLDIMMSGLDGFETARQIHALPRHASTPIIYLTGDTSEETIAHAFDAGAADYITKPFRQKELQARVKNRLETEMLKNEQQKLLRRNEHLVAIMNRHIAYLKTDLDGLITEVSPSFCELYQSSAEGYEACAKNFIGHNVNMLKSGFTHKEVYWTLWNTIEKGEVYTHDIENKNLANGTNWYRVTVIPETDDDGVIEGYMAFYHNIDDEIRFEHDAHTDFLTGLYNRYIFEEKLGQEILRFQRYNDTFSLIMADIDHFKNVNDTYGHSMGDTVLKEFATLLAQTIRVTDIIARWGGEEFVILCPNTDREGALTLAETLREKTQTYSFSVPEHISASFGVGEFKNHSDAQELFRMVDEALYQAKEKGRNQVSFAY